MRCPSESEGPLFVQCTCHSFERFFTHDCFRGDTLICKICLAIRIEATWRLFYVFCFSFSHYESGVDQGLTLCRGVLGAWRFQLTCNNKPELFEKDDGLIV